MCFDRDGIHFGSRASSLIHELIIYPDYCQISGFYKPLLPAAPQQLNAFDSKEYIYIFLSLHDT